MPVFEKSTLCHFPLCKNFDILQKKVRQYNFQHFLAAFDIDFILSFSSSSKKKRRERRKRDQWPDSETDSADSFWYSSRVQTVV